MDIVEINGLHVRAEVGFSAHELGKLQELNITIHLRTSIKKAGETDRVEDTINYKTITKNVLFHVENKKYNLIEAVATDVARICVVRHGVPSVKVIVEKPNALQFAESPSVTIERCWEDFDWHSAHILLGSNEDPLSKLPQAISLLREKGITIIRLSKAFWTKPVMPTEDEAPDFVNMAALVKTKLDITGLKLVLLDIERDLGRDRKHNSSTYALDLDISFYGYDIMEYTFNCAPLGKRRVVPHLDTLKEAHVIIPLADITPDYVHPQTKKSLKAMAEEISGTEDYCSLFSTVQEKEFLGMINDYSHGNILLSADVLSSDLVDQLTGRRPLANENLPSNQPNMVALVTGAAKRLGACIARKLHAAGYRVVIHYNKSKSEANHLLRELNSVRSNSATLVQGDLACDVNKTAQQIINEAVEVWGRLDVLVNNASQFYPTHLGSVTEKDWADLIQANLTSPFFLSQAAHPFLKATEGSIVNLCDIHAVRPKSDYSVYCISKAGLHMGTFSLAKEFAPNVRVNGVAPGCILLPEESWEGVSADERDLRLKEIAAKHQESLKKVPFGRIGKPDDIADAVLFLCRSAAYITGQIVAVDGGRSLHQ